MTFSEGQQLAVDPEASLRAELLGTIDAAQFDIANAIAELARGGADVSALTNQSQALLQLQKQVGNANLGGLVAMRTEIASAVALTQAIAQQSRTSATTAEQATASLATVSAETRRAVQSISNDVFERKLFDPYLEFASAEDEAAYRKREAERQQTIAAELAKHTPAGDLNAAGATIGQMTDAKAHGAGNSPEFESRWNELVATTQRLRDEIVRSGGSTKEFDDKLRDDLRTIMKSKGLSDAEIDARLAAHADNPLEAAKDFVGETEIQRLSNDTVVTRELKPEQAMSIEAVETPLPRRDSTDFMAKFRATGVTVEEHSAEDYTHGVNAANQIVTVRAK